MRVQPLATLVPKVIIVSPGARKAIAYGRKRSLRPGELSLTRPWVAESAISGADTCQPAPAALALFGKQKNPN